MLWCARYARPVQPVNGPTPSRFPASVGSPTWSVAPLTAISIWTTVSATAHRSHISSGFMTIPLSGGDCHPKPTSLLGAPVSRCEPLLAAPGGLGLPGGAAELFAARYHLPAGELVHLFADRH